MNPERWHEVQEIFLSALDVRADSREEFVARACSGDPVLIADVKSLLEVQEKVSSRFLERSKDGSVLEPPPERIAAEGEGRAFGPYVILRMLGRGGQGEVHLAQDTRLPRKVALKLLPKSPAGSSAALRRFRREAAAISRLDHPGICTLYETGEAEGFCYIAMRYIEGHTLAQEVAAARTSQTPGLAATSGDGADASCSTGPADDRSGQRKSPPIFPNPPIRVEIHRSVRLIERAAGALHAAHGAGLIHRDIKPANIMVTAEDEPVILDFGIARDAQSDGATVTQSGDVVGTPAYMSPEQIESKGEPLDHRTDVYSLGVTLFELVTLTRPFDRPTKHDLYKVIMTEEAPDPQKLNPNISRDLKAILEKSLEKERSRRYSGAAELAEDLRHFLAGKPVTARPVPPWQRAMKWAKRRPALAALVAVCWVAVLGLLGLGTWFTLKLKGERDRVTAEHEDGRLSLYLSDIHLAHAAWNDSWVNRVLEILDGEGCRPSRPDQKDLRGWEWYYLHGLCHNEVWALEDGRVRSPCSPNSACPSSVAWSPDGRWIAAANWDSPIVLLWDLTRNESPRRLSGHYGHINSLAFGPDSEWLISGGEDGYTKLWDVKTGKELRCFAAAWWVHGVAISPDRRFIAAGKELMVWVWDMITGSVISLAGHSAKIACVAFSPDGRQLASAGSDGVARVWDKANWKEVLTLRGHLGGIWSLVFSPDSKTLATAGEDAVIRLWDAATGDLRATLREHTVWIGSVAFSPDGRRVASAGGDQTVKIWDIARGESILTLKGHTTKANSVAFSPDGRFLVSACEDGTVIIWDTAIDCQEARNLWQEERGNVLRIAVDVAFSPDGHWIGIASRDGTARLFDVASGDERRVLKGHLDEVWVVAFSPDSRRVATGSDDTTARVWNLEDGRELLRLEGHKGSVRGLSFSPDGARVATGAIEDDAVRLWDAKSGKLELLLKGHKSGVRGVEFSPNGLRLASGSADQTVKIWNSENWRIMHTLSGHKAEPTRLAFSRDGRLLASANWDSTIELWDVESGADLRTFRGHTGVVLDVDFSPDGRCLASGSADRSLKLWDTSSGHEMLSLKDGFDPREPLPFVYGVSFSRDGRWLASCGQGSLKLREAPRDAKLLSRTTFDHLRSPEVMCAWHRREAQACEVSTQWFAVAFHLSRLVDAGQDQADLYLRRGRAYSELGDWERAAADLTKARELGSAGTGALEAAIAAKDWVIGQLRDGGSVRLRCGGSEHRGADGKLWAADRFSTAGESYTDSVQVLRTDDPALYQTGRYFPSEKAMMNGYHLPLPNGRYSVGLHFSETSAKSAGERFFDILLERDRVSKAFEPLAAGFATALQETFKTTVSDGYLDLEFVRRAGDPIVSALEVMKLDDLVPPVNSAEGGLGPPALIVKRSNFEDEFRGPDGPPRGWTPFLGGWEIVSEALYLTAPLPCEGWIVAGDPAIHFSFVQSIEFDFQFLNRPKSDQGRHGGVCFFAQDLGGKFSGSGYSLAWNDAPDNHGYRLTVWRPRGWAVLFQKADEPEPGKRWRIEIQEEVIRVLVDGKLKGEARDATYRSGLLGFWTYCFGVRICVDNVKVGETPRQVSPAPLPK